jgi:hypothetical protein
MEADDEEDGDGAKGLDVGAEGGRHVIVVGMCDVSKKKDEPPLSCIHKNSQKQSLQSQPLTA